MELAATPFTFFEFANRSRKGELFSRVSVPRSSLLGNFCRPIINESLGHEETVEKLWKFVRHRRFVFPRDRHLSWFAVIREKSDSEIEGDVAWLHIIRR